MPEIHTNVLNKVKNIINSSENLSITSDIWTNNSNRSVINLTDHCIKVFIVQSFERKNLILRVHLISFAGSHTYIKISRDYRENYIGF